MNKIINSQQETQYEELTICNIFLICTDFDGYLLFIFLNFIVKNMWFVLYIGFPLVC